MTVELVFHCSNCKTDWPEAFCESCGARLMPRLVAVPDPPTSEWRELMTALARDQFAKGNNP